MESVAELLERGHALSVGTSYGLTFDDEATPITYDTFHLQWWLGEAQELLKLLPKEAGLFDFGNILEPRTHRDPLWSDAEVIAGWEKALALLADVQQRHGLA